MRRFCASLAALLCAGSLSARAADAGARFAEQASPASDCSASLPAARIKGAADGFERAAACEGLARAQAFFLAHGMRPSLSAPALGIRFEAVARAPCQPSGSNKTCEGMRVAAFYDASAHEVVATRPNASWMRAKNRPYFTLPFDKELYVSVMAHEATHALSKQFYRFAPDSHAQDEYIAYASQLWSMDPSTRERVLRAYPTPEFEFSDEMNINDIVHFGGPHAFGAMSYRHFTGPAGGAPMLARIYSGAFKPPTLDMPS